MQSGERRLDTNTDVGGLVKAYCWSFGRAEFDESRWELRVAGQPVGLERKPLEVLQYLLRHAGEVVTKEELLAEVWAGRIVVEAVLTNAVGKLRKALDDGSQETVTTLSRVGYRLAVPVSRRPVEYLPEASQLQAGDAVPRRQNWKLETPLARTQGNEVWLARHAKTGETRVLKFSLTGKGLHALKREVTIARLLRGALGERGDFVRVIDWDFDQAPYFIESEYGGIGLDHWPQGDAIATTPLLQRLTLFAEAAEAVAAAHGIGVLHKDLKPANLLVYEVDGMPRLRVADFGSSRLFDSGRLDDLGITHLELSQTQAISTDTTGTPMYLAPELAAGQASTVKSDIYALGVTLYQLIVGDFRRSLSPGWESDIADPLLRQDIADAASGDPAKRPDSAALLAERIRNLEVRREQRALEEAVRARIADGEKRLAKVRARRPWMIAAMTLLLGGLASTSWLLLQVWRSERQATEQRDVALALNRFVEEDILGAANPMRVGRSDITMRDALDAASSRIESRFASQPEVAGPLAATVGKAYYVLSDYASAEEYFRRSSEYFARLGGVDSADAISMRLQQAQAAARAGRSDQARDLLEGLEPRIEALGPERRTHERILFDIALAWTEFSQGNFLEAVAPMEHAAGLLALLPEPDPALEMEVTQALMVARGFSGQLTTEMTDLQENALSRMQSARSDATMPMELSMRYGLLRMRMLAGEERSLEADYRQVIAELSDTLGPLNEATLLAMHGLAHIYFKQEKWEECRLLGERVQRGLGELLGPGHIQSVNAANTLGACLLGRGEVAKAASVFETALAGIRDQEGVRVGLVRTAVQINLGHVLVHAGQWQQLDSLLGDIHASGSKLLSASDEAAGEVELVEGSLLAARGNKPAAKVKLARGIEMLSKKNPPEYWLIRQGRQALAALDADVPAR